MTRKRHLTAQIKPATRDAIMDQLALAADEIVDLNRALHTAAEVIGEQRNEADGLRDELARVASLLTAAEDRADFYMAWTYDLQRPWYRRLLDWLV